MPPIEGSTSGQGENDAERPLLETLVSDALTLFYANQTWASEYSNNEPYGLYKAAADSLVQTGKDAIEVFSEIKDQTRFTPKDIGMGLQDADSWTELFGLLNQEIIISEMEAREPEIRKESERRLNS